MYKTAITCLCIAAVLLTAAFVVPVAADVELTDVSWETLGTNVRFHLQFHNPDLMNPSGEVSGVLSSQPFVRSFPTAASSPLQSCRRLRRPASSTSSTTSACGPTAERAGYSVGRGWQRRIVSRSVGDLPSESLLGGNVDVFWVGPRRFRQRQLPLQHHPGLRRWQSHVHPCDLGLPDRSGDRLELRIGTRGMERGTAQR